MHKQSVGARLFVDCIIEDKAVTPGFSEGYKAQRVIDAALESDKEGREVKIS
jgi:predicted dehydrogenase